MAGASRVWWGGALQRLMPKHAATRHHLRWLCVRRRQPTSELDRAHVPSACHQVQDIRPGLSQPQPCTKAVHTPWLWWQNHSL